MKINVKLSALRAISQFSADQDIRYYLNTVRVEADKNRTILTATDGHCLGIHRTLRASSSARNKSVLRYGSFVQVHVKSQPNLTFSF